MAHEYGENYLICSSFCIFVQNLLVSSVISSCNIVGVSDWAIDNVFCKTLDADLGNDDECCRGSLEGFPILFSLFWWINTKKIQVTETATTGVL